MKQLLHLRYRDAGTFASTDESLRPAPSYVAWIGIGTSPGAMPRVRNASVGRSATGHGAPTHMTATTDVLRRPPDTPT